MITVELARWRDKLGLACAFGLISVAGYRAFSGQAWLVAGFAFVAGTVLFVQNVAFDKDTKNVTYSRGVFPFVIRTTDQAPAISGIELRARTVYPQQWGRTSSYRTEYETFTGFLVWAEPE